MNSTLKMVRGKIVERHKELIGFLYTPEAKPVNNRKNMETMKELLK